MLKVVKHARRDRIYGYPDECGFGDIWAVTSYLLRISEEASSPSRFFTKSKTFKSTMQAILPFLKSKGSIEFIGGKSAQRIFDYCEPYRAKFVPTINRWKFRNRLKSKIIAYQFDGSHMAKYKNITGKRLASFLNSLIKMGYEPINVGGQSVEFVVKTLAEARLFVGCPSGLSIAAISVGTPTFLITKMLKVDFVRFLRSCQYHTRSVRTFRTVDQFLFCLNRERRMCPLL